MSTTYAVDDSRYRAVFEAARTAWLSRPREGVIAEVNTAFCSMHGYTREAVALAVQHHLAD